MSTGPLTTAKREFSCVVKILGEDVNVTTLEAISAPEAGPVTGPVILLLLEAWLSGAAWLPKDARVCASELRGPYTLVAKCLRSRAVATTAQATSEGICCPFQGQGMGRVMYDFTLAHPFNSGLQAWFGSLPPARSGAEMRLRWRFL